jgi:hypothetical protein
MELVCLVLSVVLVEVHLSLLTGLKLVDPLFWVKATTVELVVLLAVLAVAVRVLSDRMVLALLQAVAGQDLLLPCQAHR